ncbi:MAG: Prolyl-tRNA synthetase [Candidatus Azambacteria bacterium GW2011_GWA2_39_10]|uniref:Proline--tRNA ligase n=1 Tax=Candidatus Azambacteria bacterium GW2011_GWA2_39_10 TaxID=1618611 RepID=A0A0G0LMI7_9BACT|nr:MAG: Prolyl-tRNA synthetase [Candidatus Azambacteria bacterium GW2011_GWA2_39_10]
MKQSQLFGKTLREAPKDAEAISHIYLVRGGFIRQLSSGLFSFLPLGFMVLKKIEQVIREELGKIGVQEMIMPVIHPAEIWKKTGRYHEIGKELWRLKSQGGQDLVLSMTHEESMAEIASKYIEKYDDLPVFLNQFQIKLRNEARPRGGLLRLREFVMQDAYSFDKNEAELDKTYNKFFKVYQNIFKRLNIKTIPIKADSGIMGGQESHEFMMLAEIGEDKLDGRNAIELGHIFKLGIKYSKPFNIYFTNKNGKKELAIMGSYGIGLDRLMAAMVETHNDKNGIIWPESVAPFKIHLIELKSSDSAVKKETEKIYKTLLDKGIEVLYDDRDDKSAGEKFADADLIGIPWRAVVSQKTLEKDSLELKRRNQKRIELIKISKFQNFKI